MEVSPKTLREVEFREKMRGYHPEDVDHFLEQVAAGIEVLQDRLRQAVERAQRAEAAATEAGSDETLRKTLVLAQRTADLAVQEAREQASRILAAAEQQAQAILGEAEERGRRTLEDAVAESRSELARLESIRGAAQHDVDSLQRWLDEHKSHLQATLSEALSAVEKAGVLWPAPDTRPVEGTGRRPQAVARGLEPEPEPVMVTHEDPGPNTMAWSPTDEERAEMAAEPAPVHERPGIDLNEQALDDFFDDEGDYEEDRRLGGRLRRRR